MAEENNSDEEKTEEPSTHRIEQFRKRGEVASSKELTSVLVLAGTTLTLGLSIVYIYETLAAFVEWLYALEVSKAYAIEGQKLVMTRVIMVTLKCLAPVFISAFCIAIIANMIQVGVLFAPEVLKFKPERINPIAGIKRIFTMKSIVEAIKGVFKFSIISSIVYFFMKDDINTYSGFLHLGLVQSFMLAKWMFVKLGMFILLGLLLVALGDFAFQKYSYKKKLKTSKYQAKKELKEQEGSPEIKQKIKAIQREMSQKRMITEIPNADVIVTNPTHLSVALKYDAENMVSPIVLAKGADFMAFKIREIAKKHKIPIVENVPLARSLYRTVKVGGAVPRNLYKTIAEVLAFVYKLKRKDKAVSVD